MLGLRFLWDYSPIRAGRGSSPEAATFALQSNLLGDQDLKEAALAETGQLDFLGWGWGGGI